MDQIDIRYGESVVLPFDAADPTATSADIFIGKPGQMYVLTKSITLDAGIGTFLFSEDDTKIPLDTYYYQINVYDTSGQKEIYPEPEEDCGGCDSQFPKFVVHESLDQIEVS